MLITYYPSIDMDVTTIPQVLSHQNHKPRPAIQSETGIQLITYKNDNAFLDQSGFTCRIYHQWKSSHISSYPLSTSSYQHMISLNTF